MHAGSVHRTFVLLAMGGAFSAAVLGGLLGRGLRPAAVVLPGPGPAAPAGLPVTVTPAPGSVPGLAAAAGAPVHRLRRRDWGRLAALLARLDPEVLAVACFPWRLPAEILAAPAAGCLNLHPSLLPRYRGPEPLFWQLRAGEGHTGITVHRMTPALDAGDILARAEVPLPTGAPGPDLEALLAARGADLLAGLLRGGALAGVPQDEAGASCQPAPTREDFSLDPSWPASRAYSFLRGTAHWGVDYRWLGRGCAFRLAGAAGFRAVSQAIWSPRAPAGVLSLACSPGVLHALPAAGAHHPRGE